MGITESPVMNYNLADLIQEIPHLEPLIEPFSTLEIDLIIKNLPLDKAPAWFQWEVPKEMLVDSKGRFL